MGEVMDPRIAQALADLVGPMMAEGMKLGIAEGVAKLRAFEAGTYPGEACEHCGIKVALLDPWRRVGGKVVIRLCHACGQGAALSIDREAAEVRALPRSDGADLFCSRCRRGKDVLYGGRCWECAHVFMREQAGHDNETGYADTSFRHSSKRRVES